ncbi:hypothetical protein CLOM_g17730 [Closterium sp. NIES-68]|nr:hypothetical protein CLOM_g17730 [Closterium sp. NIES-68]
MNLPTFNDVAGGKVSPLFVAAVVATSVVALHWVAIRWSSASDGASDGASGGAGSGASWSYNWWFGKRVESGECGVRPGTGRPKKTRRRKKRTADEKDPGEEESPWEEDDDGDEGGEEEGVEGGEGGEEGGEREEGVEQGGFCDRSGGGGLGVEDKPQRAFRRVLADNSRAPFLHLKRNETVVNEDEEESEDSGDLHPFGDEIRQLIQTPPPANHMLPPGTTPPPMLNDSGVSDLPSQAPSSSSSSFQWVSTRHQLAALAALLEKQDEFAVDTEQHSHRSYLGFTALIQISTRDGWDFVVDAIALHDRIGDALRPAFANPAISKLFHGADSDVLWLQRDFHIYTVNLFDTARHG